MNRPSPQRRTLLRQSLMLAGWFLPAAGHGEPARRAAIRPARIVSLGATATEIVFALGAGPRVVGVDLSSRYPAEATRLPQVGYYRDFSVEGVVSLNPDLVIASSHAGPAQAIQRLGRLGLPIVTLPADPTVPALEQAIALAGQALQAEAAADRLVQGLQQALATPATARSTAGVLVLSSHSGRMQAAGSRTAADATLRLAGGVNLLTEQSGYKPISAEAITALAPEIILTTPLSIPPGGPAAFARQPGISTTPAARHGRIHVIDELLLLGFGPRLPEALRVLREALAPPQRPPAAMAG